MLKQKEIDDEKAKQLLNEIFENLENDDLIETNTKALEKKYRKPEGTISDFIFYEDLSINEIMQKLKIDNVTYL